MPDRADAHIHLFEGGFRQSLAGRPGVTLDEAALYASLAKDYDVRAALIVGYAGEPWAATNNKFLTRMVRQHDWVRPVAYVEPDAPPAITTLEEWGEQGFVGLSFYIFGPQKVEALRHVPEQVWHWLAARRWLVSVNSRGGDWAAWQEILGQHGGLRLLVSHLGLPPRMSCPPAAAEAKAALADVLALAAFPGVRVKLSGFYALTDPGYDYPHRAAWPYVEALLESFGAGRLLWASDFTPCLDSLTFPQTFGLFSHMPFLDETDRRRIEGENLLALLAETRAPG